MTADQGTEERPENPLEKALMQAVKAGVKPFEWAITEIGHVEHEFAEAARKFIYDQDTPPAPASTAKPAPQLLKSDDSQSDDKPEKSDVRATAGVLLNEILAQPAAVQEKLSKQIAALQAALAGGKDTSVDIAEIQAAIQAAISGTATADVLETPEKHASRLWTEAKEANKKAEESAHDERLEALKTAEEQKQETAEDAEVEAAEKAYEHNKTEANRQRLQAASEKKTQDHVAHLQRIADDPNTPPELREAALKAIREQNDWLKKIKEALEARQTAKQYDQAVDEKTNNKSTETGKLADSLDQAGQASAVTEKPSTLAKLASTHVASIDDLGPPPPPSGGQQVVKDASMPEQPTILAQIDPTHIPSIDDLPPPPAGAKPAAAQNSQNLG